MKSFYGTVLEVNLTSGQYKKYNLEEEILDKYIGGSGIATKLLMDNTDDKTDPLGPDNILIFSSIVIINSFFCRTIFYII